MWYAVLRKCFTFCSTDYTDDGGGWGVVCDDNAIMTWLSSSVKKYYVETWAEISFSPLI